MAGMASVTMPISLRMPIPGAIPRLAVTDWLGEITTRERRWLCLCIVKLVWPHTSGSGDRLLRCLSLLR
jgi:hypothetical protein